MPMQLSVPSLHRSLPFRKRMTLPDGKEQTALSQSPIFLRTSFIKHLAIEQHAVKMHRYFAGYGHLRLRISFLLRQP